MPPTKHQRAKKPKSRNGCITCKMRHVKCDEGKPECRQCTDSGRKCDGYKAASQTQLRNEISQALPRHAWSVSPDQSLVLLPGSREERQYVHFFSTQATRALSGFFPSDFWIQFIPQLSHHSPTIRHAVAAVGAVYERQANRLLLPATEEDPSEAEQFELQQYNKAIQGFVTQLSSPDGIGVDMILVTCVLFVCLEMLRNNRTPALNHVQAGLQILAGHLRHGKAIIRNDFDRELFQLFHRLNLQISFFGRPLLQLDIPIEKPASLITGEKLVFNHVSQARECLTDLVNRAMAFIREVEYPQETPSEAKRQKQLLHQQRVVQEFCSWNAAFETMKTKSTKRVGISDVRAPLVLQIEYHTINIWLKSCISPAQTYLDQFFKEFDLVVSAAEKIIELGTGPDSTDFPMRFTLDAEVIPPLYWTAQKCRDPLIRRRAIAAIQNYPSREGMWDKRRYVEASTKIMAFEEVQCTHLPVEQRLPAEECRIHDALIFSDEVRDGNPYPVLYLWKPQGLDTEFEQCWNEVHW